MNSLEAPYRLDLNDDRVFDEQVEAMPAHCSAGIGS
jgi:hypothetical protein